MKIAIAAAASIILSTAASTAAFAQEAVIQVNQAAVVAQPVMAAPVVVRTTTFAATYPGKVIYTCPVVPDCRLPNGLLYAGIYTDIDKHGYMCPYGI